MPERWIPEAEDLKSNGQSGTMSRNHAGVKVTWHVTVSHPGSFGAMHGVLTRNRSEPHVLYDPAGDRLGQYFPLDRSARALANDGSRPTNRDGTINIQIEICAMPGNKRTGDPGFTDLPEFDTSAPNWQALMRAIRSWGIPDEWPGGRVASGNWGSEEVSRDWGDYRKSGHFGHSQVPGNDHWDPGYIDQGAIFGHERGGGAQSVDFDVPEPKPEKGGDFTPLWTPTGKLSVREIQKIVGVTADNLYGRATLEAVRDYQRDELGVTADGLWGKSTEAAHFRRVRKAKRPRLSNLKRGAKGGRVRNLQRGLNRAFPAYSSLAVDGIFGRGTAGVVMEFQRRSGLVADGIVGRRTRAALARYGIKA